MRKRIVPDVDRVCPSAGIIAFGSGGGQDGKAKGSGRWLRSGKTLEIRDNEVRQCAKFLAASDKSIALMIAAAVG
jgi:hypothetical protein